MNFGKELGLSSGDVRKIRSYYNEFPALLKAAELIYDSTRDKSKITYSTLAAVTRIDDKNIPRSLRREYMDRQKEIVAYHDLRPPYIELLRQDAMSNGGFNAQLPFLEERGEWKRFEPSNNDWLDDIHLPKPPYDRETSQTMGIIWGDGIVLWPYLDFRLSGRSDDQVFYKNIVAPRIRKLFGVPAKVRTEKREGYTYPSIWVDSRAVATWLTHDMGLPPGRKRNVELPKYCDRRGLFEGLHASMGCKIINRKRFKMFDSDEFFIQNINKLAKELGHNPSRPHLQNIYNPVSKSWAKSWGISYGIYVEDFCLDLNPRNVP